MGLRAGPPRSALLGLAVSVAVGATRAALAQSSMPAKDSSTAAAAPQVPGYDFAAIEARVQALEKEVDDTKALVAEAGGKLLKAPPELPDRFKQPVMLEAVRLAFRQVNPRAEVAGIDCAEYPCIAYGNGVKREQLGALKSSLALAGYAQDNVSTFTWGDTVAVIPTPKNDPNQGDEAEQRILTRFHQMVTTGKAP
jgi:hypothetical protein